MVGVVEVLLEMSLQTQKVQMVGLVVAVLILTPQQMAVREILQALLHHHRVIVVETEGFIHLHSVAVVEEVLPTPEQLAAIKMGMVVLAQHLLFLVQAHRPSTLVVVEAVLMGRPLAQEAQVAGAMVVLEQAQGREPQPLLVGLQIPAVEVVEVAILLQAYLPKVKTAVLVS